MPRMIVDDAASKARYLAGMGACQPKSPNVTDGAVKRQAGVYSSEIEALQGQWNDHASEDNPAPLTCVTPCFWFSEGAVQPAAESQTKTHQRTVSPSGNTAE